MKHAWTYLVVLGMLAATTNTQAQRRRTRLPPCESASHDSRALYICGLHAVEELRYQDGARLFGESYAAGHEARALFNQAVALKSMGHFLEARTLFQSVMENHANDTEVAREAALQLVDVESSIAVIALSVSDTDGVALPVDSLEVLLNGRPIDLVDGAVRADPDEIAIEVRAPGFAPERWDGHVQTGRREVRLTMSRLHTIAVPIAVPDDATDNDTVDPPPPSSNVFESPTFWGVTAGILVLAGGAVLTVVLVQDREQQIQLRPAADFRSTDVFRF